MAIISARYFNTKKVRLKPPDQVVLDPFAGSFQYQKGAIKTILVFVFMAFLKNHFNTKKVRLKRNTSPPRPSAPAQFQYQKGAIKTKTACRTSSSLSKPFQYQKGAIKTDGERLTSKRAVVFQYQKGAIKTVMATYLIKRLLEFQYQKGAIKTLHSPSRIMSASSHFNTKKVRLKPRPFKEQNRVLEGIISDLIGNVKPPVSSSSGYPRNPGGPTTSDKPF